MDSPVHSPGAVGEVVGSLAGSVLNERGALPVLVALQRAEAILMKEFKNASGLAFTTAKALRDKLVDAGIITVEPGAARGAREEQIIKLTDLGKRIATPLRHAADALDAARPKGEPSSDSERALVRTRPATRPTRSRKR